jgi:glyoxylase I family protein
MITSIHHIAYRYVDALKTVRFYQNYLGLEFSLAIAEFTVPSTGKINPYMHVFYK